MKSLHNMVNCRLLYISVCIFSFDFIKVESRHWKGLTPQVSPNDGNFQIFSNNQVPKYQVVLYEEGMFQGNMLQLDLALNECVDLPYAFNDATSSVDTYSHCVILCEDHQCAGQCKKFGPDTENHGYYITDDFNDKASSILLCGVDLGSEAIDIIEPQALVSPEYESPLITRSPGPKFEITIYEDGFYQGRSLEIHMGRAECIDIPVPFNDKVSSVDIHGNCVILCEHTDCGGKCHKYEFTSDPWVGNDLNDMVSSIKLCN